MLRLLFYAAHEKYARRMWHVPGRLDALSVKVSYRGGAQKLNAKCVAIDAIATAL